MRVLLDTHVLLWTASRTRQLSPETVDLLCDPANVLHFSVVSIWELAIKAGLGRPDFRVEPHMLRRALLDQDFEEVSITAAHALEVSFLPLLHRDPFDRMLVAQARCEGLLLLTADRVLAGYDGPIRLVSSPSLRHP